MNDLFSLKIGDDVITPPPDFITTQPGTGLGDIIQWILYVLVAVAVTAALIFVIIGAIRWITSGGDKEKLATARKTIIFAIIGLLLVLLSVVLMQFIETALGLRGEVTSTASIKTGDCPDGSGNYSCGKTQDTSCPLCSADKNCRSGVYSIAQCSPKNARCEVNAPAGQSCPLPNCPLGMRGVAYCTPATPGSETGFCESNCVEIDPRDMQ